MHRCAIQWRWMYAIHGNERADAAAKSALSLPITNMKLSGYDLIPRVSLGTAWKNGKSSTGSSPPVWRNVLIGGFVSVCNIINLY